MSFRTTCLRSVFFVMMIWGAAPALASNAGEQIRLLVTAESATVSNIRYGGQDELTMEAGEKVLHQKTSDTIAVVITNQRVAACGVQPRGWKVLPMGADEKLEHLEVHDKAANVVTGTRAMHFSLGTGEWSEKAR